MNEPTVNKYEKHVSSWSVALGVSDEVAATLMSQALNCCIPVNETPTDHWDCILALLCSFEPRNSKEAMIAIQAVGMHYHAADLLAKAVKSDFLDTKEQYLKVAVKISKHFSAQLEVLKKLRSKCDQRIVVERVNVHSGAQAVVGHIEATGGGI